MKTSPRHKKGFTLIEILVVVAIIGFILAIMFPVMGKARSVAKRAVCINNLRQLYFSMLSYVEDHNGTYPGVSFSIADLLPYMDNGKENMKCPIEDKYYDEGVISYGYNGNLNGMWARIRTPLPDTILFCDSGSGFVYYKDEPDLDRHGKNLGQAVYADGHVALINTANLADRPGPPGGPYDYPPGAGGCFLAGTPILMADGTTKPIDKLTIGEAIMAFDEGTKEFKPDNIKHVFVFPKNNDGYLIINNRINVTSHHRFYVTKRNTQYSILGANQWAEAGKLEIGDLMLNAQGKPETITSIERIEDTLTVYNLEVNPYSTFIADGVVVHNARAAWAGSDGPILPSAPSDWDDLIK